MLRCSSSARRSTRWRWISFAVEVGDQPGQVAEAYLLDQKRILPAASLLEGEYGYRDLYMGFPVVIGGKGIEKIIELSLTDDDKEMLKKSAGSVQSVVNVVKAAS